MVNRPSINKAIYKIKEKGTGSVHGFGKTGQVCGLKA